VERERRLLLPEWAHWILFGINAIAAIFWATAGDVAVLAGLFGFTAGLAFMNALFQPALDRLDGNLRDLMAKVEDLKRRV
jgi:hypothetical protein